MLKAGLGTIFLCHPLQKLCLVPSTILGISVIYIHKNQHNILFPNPRTSFTVSMKNNNVTTFKECFLSLMCHPWPILLWEKKMKSPRNIFPVTQIWILKSVKGEITRLCNRGEVFPLMEILGLGKMRYLPLTGLWMTFSLCFPGEK